MTKRLCRRMVCTPFYFPLVVTLAFGLLAMTSPAMAQNGDKKDGTKEKVPAQNADKKDTTNGKDPTPAQIMDAIKTLGKKVDGLEEKIKNLEPAPTKSSHSNYLERIDKFYDARQRYLQAYIELQRPHTRGEKYYKEKLDALVQAHTELTKLKHLDHYDLQAAERLLFQRYLYHRQQLENESLYNLGFQLKGVQVPDIFTIPVPAWESVPVVPGTPCPPLFQRLQRRADAGADMGPNLERILGAGAGLRGTHGRGFKVPQNFAAIKQKLNATRRASVRDAHKAQLANLPPNFDTRAIMVASVPPIRDQGGCGVCWIFGTVGAYEFNYLYTNQGQVVDASEQYVMNCISSVDSPCDGASPQDAARFLKSPGTAARSEVPYAGTPQNCGGTIRFLATEFAYVDSDRDIPSDDELKAAIKQYGAVVVGIHAGEQGSRFQSYTGGTFDVGDVGDVDHAVALVGWNTIGNQTYWILRNSWGTSWGDNGYMTIRSGVNSVGFGALWISASASSNPPPVNPSNGSPLNDRINYWKLNNPKYVPAGL